MHRIEYTMDVAKASKEHIVLVMDFAQNLTIPHVPDTPSGWYFLSLWAISMFGVYCANDQQHHHYLYSERKGSKGPNEVISMIARTIESYGLLQSSQSDQVDNDVQSVKLTVWADNCAGQNKNSYVIWFLLLLVEYGVVCEAELKFFQKGHTKNACDRGFGDVKRHMARASCWTMEAVANAVSAASRSSKTTNLDTAEAPFSLFKEFLGTRYKKIVGIQKYQLFRVSREKPGHVECRRTPASEPKWWCATTRMPQTFKKFKTTWESIPTARDKPLNPETLVDISNKVLPYVPKEFAGDDLYTKPTMEMQEEAKKIKRRRRDSAAKRRAEGDEGKAADV